MLKFYFSREKRAFCLIVQEPDWLQFCLSLFGLWWLVSLPWQLLVMLYYEPAAWPVLLYNVGLFSVLAFIVWWRGRPGRAPGPAAGRR